LIKKYIKIKRSYLLGKYEEVIKHEGKFSEPILALIENKFSGKVVNLDKIKFNESFRQIESYSKTSVERRH